MMSSGIVRGLDRLANWIAHLLGGLAAVSTVILMVAITYGVIMRFVFGNAQSWTDELAAFSLAWLVFFGLAYTLATDGHVRISFFTDFLPPKARRPIEAATYAIGLVFSVLLFMGCLETFKNFLKRDTHSIGGLDVPLYYPATALLVGSVALGLVMLARGCRVLAEGPIPPDPRGGGTPT